MDEIVALVKQPGQESGLAPFTYKIVQITLQAQTKDCLKVRISLFGAIFITLSFNFYLFWQPWHLLSHENFEYIFSAAFIKVQTLFAFALAVEDCIFACISHVATLKSIFACVLDNLSPIFI